jgi:chromosome partitioning protein
LIEHIGKISEITNPDLEYLGALLTRHDQTKNVNKAIAFSVSELEKDLSTSGRLLPVYIHNSIKVGESSIVSAPIRNIARSNKVTKDYENLATYLIKELKLARSYAVSGNKK